MILEGNQRGGWRDLGLHLLKDENDHVEVHELSGFVSDDLLGAFKETYAVSRGTRAKQYFFSLSMNPPPDEKVPTEVFLAAIPRIEAKLRLVDQPRAVVFHEKEGRRHAHVVWSRIDAGAMKAIQMSHYKRKLGDVSRELYIENDWTMPSGFANSALRDPRNFTLAQWQQAKRQGKDPRVIKEAIQDSWAISDSQASLKAALQERGYILAKGRKKTVAVDLQGEVYALSKWTGKREKEIRAKVQNQSELPSVEEAQIEINQLVAKRLSELGNEQQAKIRARLSKIRREKQALIKRQSRIRAKLAARQRARQIKEINQRSSSYKRGIRGLLQNITGEKRRLINEHERGSYLALKRDQRERDDLIFAQLEDRKRFSRRTTRLSTFGRQQMRTLSKERDQLIESRQNKTTRLDVKQSRSKGFELDR